MSEPLTLGIAGLGTVGGGLVDLIHLNGQHMSSFLGREIRIAGVSAKAKSEAQREGLANATFFSDAVALAKDPSIAIFVELIGGEGGIAKASVEAALNAKKHVVTANKALLATHGVELAKLAEKNGVALYFEAAVAGAIPVIKTLRESLSANRIKRVYGILNGTCNFILTQMQNEKRAFADVLKEAQALGYAEADPTFDVGGFDTAHKLAILTSLAFGTKVALDQIHVEGIQSITQADIEATDSLGYRIKLLGVARETESGIEARVSPALVYKDSAIAEVSGVTNAVAIDADFAGNILLVGAGAGAKANGVGSRQRHHRYRLWLHYAAVRHAKRQVENAQERQTRFPLRVVLCAPRAARQAGRHGGHRKAHGRPRNLARKHRATPPRRAADAGRGRKPCIAIHRRPSSSSRMRRRKRRCARRSRPSRRMAR